MLKRPWIKPLVWIVCLAPFAELVWRIAHNDVTANPTEFIEHFTGDWTLRLVVATLAITPLRKLLGLPDLIRFRRLIGLFAFFYVCLHFTTYLWFDQNFDFAAIWKDIAKRPYITVGFTGFCLLIPLAVTSTKGWIRRMGGKNWSRLHRLIYVTAICGVIHYYWLVKSDVRMPLLYAALVGALLLYRVIMKLKIAKRAVAGVAASSTLFLFPAQPARAARPADAQPAPQIAIANFHQVDAGVYRGAQPDAAGYRALAHLGVKTILDLRHSGDSQTRERQLVEAAGMTYVGLGFSGYSAPTAKEMRQALDLLESQSATPVFVHCRRGADRTGTVIACYRMERDGWNNDKALGEARQEGMSWLEGGMRRFILSYRPTLSAATAVAAPAGLK